MRPRDTITRDLFREYEPEPVVDRFDETVLRASTLDGKLAKAIARALGDAKLGRPEIAQAMSEFLGDDVSRAMLDKYSSQAATEHTISALRLLALVAVTGDVRPMNALLDDIELIVVPKKYEALLRRERAREMRERLEREEQAADAEWKARR